MTASYEAILATIERLAADVRSGSDRRPPELCALSGAADTENGYYRLLYEIGREYAPTRILEIGTFMGTSAAHLALGHPDCGTNIVTTVDSNEDAAEQVAGLGYRNIHAVTSDSVSYLRARPGHPSKSTPLIAYIDGEHNFTQAYTEYGLCRELVGDRGILLFDDIDLPMGTREMHVFWEYVVDPKVKLDGLHHTGFGAAVVDLSRPLPLWEEIITEATARFAR